ncbi:MAG: hypothetical protein HQ503_03685, partial [Rhodospirillales bacterium]|nr:hypothetical protein [Rhodospirillales bacterium]
IDEHRYKKILAVMNASQKPNAIPANPPAGTARPPFWPTPQKKPEVTPARVEAIALPPLDPVPDARPDITPQPLPDAREPTAPDIDRLQRRLKTIQRKSSAADGRTLKSDRRDVKKNLSSKAKSKDQDQGYLSAITDRLAGIFKPTPDEPLVPVDDKAQTASQLPPDTRSLNASQSGGAPNPFDPKILPPGSILPISGTWPGEIKEIDKSTRRRSAVTPGIERRPHIRPPQHKPVVPVKISSLRAPLKAASKFIAPVTNLAASNPPVYQELARLTEDVRQSETRNIQSRKSEKEPPLKRLRQPLTDIRLVLGNSVFTGQPQLPQGIAEPNACIHKRRGQVVFCIIPVDWPADIEDAFSVNTLLYQGSRAIARYDRGGATHLHALFDASKYDAILKYLSKRFGPPTDNWKRSISPFNKPRQTNPTFVWRSRDTRTDKVTILELRKYDDTRSVFPDAEHGVLRLYTAGAPKIFPVVTALDIMSIEWIARSDYIDGSLPAAASTLGGRR